MKKKERQREVVVNEPQRSRAWCRVPCACVLIVFVLLCFIIIATMWTANPNMFFNFANTTKAGNDSGKVPPDVPHPHHHSHISRFVALGVLFVFVIFVVLILFCKKFFHCLADPCLLCYAALTKLPEKKQRRLITPGVEVAGLEEAEVSTEQNKKEENTRWE